MKAIIFMCCFILAATFMQAQVILHVPGDYPTIQAAVDAAGYGDTILVAPGRYKENVVIQGNLKVVTLASNFIFTADTNDIKNTIIDGSNPLNPNYGMVVMFKNQDTTLMPKIIGFTLKNGTGYYKTYGGGIYSSGAIPVIEYNRIDSCSITGTQPNGAGIRVGQGIWDTNKVCLIRYNIIKNCTINSVSNTIEGNGGGICLGPISALVEGNIIQNNILSGNATSDAVGGGIMYYKYDNLYHTAQLIIKNNIIINNRIESKAAQGGGIWFKDELGYARLILEGNTISGNEVQSVHISGNALGGGIFIENPAGGSYISGNIISENSSLEGISGTDRFGGGMYILESLNPGPDQLLLIEKNRITQNIAVRGGGICCYYRGLEVENNFISGNQAEKLAGGIFIGGNADITASSFINNTLTNNSVSAQGDGAGSMYISNSARVLLMNNIYYGNQAPVANEIRINNGTVMIHNCDIDTNGIDGTTWTGENNFYADPEFIDEMTWDCANPGPCWDMGRDTLTAFGILFSAPDSCIGNNPRPLDQAIDVGACEIEFCSGIPIVINQTNSLYVRPNPFHDYVTVEFNLAENENVIIGLYDFTGKQVMQVFSGNLAEGEHGVVLRSDVLSPGIYLLKMESGNRQFVVKGIKR